MTATRRIRVDYSDRPVRRLRVPGPQTPGLVSTTTTFAGLLLILTPFLWSNADGLWTAAGWNEAIMGVVLAALGFLRLVFPLPLVLATGVGCAVGGWLTVAPLVLDYGLDTKSTAATIVDVVIGIAVLLVTILGHVDARSAMD